jgi:uncharacterized protein (DUF433 family)
MAETVVMAINHIVKTPGICGGKPRIDGTRLPVHGIVALIQDGATIEELIEGYAHLSLTEAQIHAALAYYYDHRKEIDDLLKREDEVFETMKREKAEVEALLATEKYIPAHDAALRLGLSPQSSQVAHLCADGKLDCRKVANRWFVSATSLDAYAAGNRKPGPK